jgi:hypothetical protein
VTVFGIGSSLCPRIHSLPVVCLPAAKNFWESKGLPPSRVKRIRPTSAMRFKDYHGVLPSEVRCTAYGDKLS